MQFLIILVVVFILYIIWKYWTLALGAGYDPTPMDKVHKMLRIAEVNENDVLYDLGSGDGRMLITAARTYGVKTIGIETDPFRYLFSLFLVLLSGYRRKITLKFGSFFKKPLGEATVVTVFLYGPTNNKLREKFQRELKPGTRVVSYVWEFSGWEPEDCLPEDRIYLYVIKTTNRHE